MTITVHPGDDGEARVWATALEVARIFIDLPWVLIGAHLVMLLEREAERPSGRTTGDVDAVVDVRTLAGGTRAPSELLVAAGFGLASAQHPYRFVRGAAQVDLLAPDHLGDNADLTTIPPARTTEIPGGSRALSTRRTVEVDVVDIGRGFLPIPSLAGAIVLKVHAWRARQAPRDAEDLVRLLALVTDVETVRGELKATTDAREPVTGRSHTAVPNGRSPSAYSSRHDRRPVGSRSGTRRDGRPPAALPGDRRRARARGHVPRSA